MKFFTNIPLLFLSLSALMVSACDHLASLPPLPQTLDYNAKAPLYLDVASIDILDASNAPDQYPFIHRHLHDGSLLERLDDWQKLSIVPVGNDNVLELYFTKLELTETTSTLSQKGELIDGHYTHDLFTVRMDVQGKLFTNHLLPDATVMVGVAQEKAIPKNGTLESRERAIDWAIYDAIKALDLNLRGQIHQHMSSIITSKPEGELIAKPSPFRHVPHFDHECTNGNRPIGNTDECR